MPATFDMKLLKSSTISSCKGNAAYETVVKLCSISFRPFLLIVIGSKLGEFGSGALRFVALFYSELPANSLAGETMYTTNKDPRLFCATLHCEMLFQLP